MEDARLHFDEQPPDLFSVRRFLVREAMGGLWEVHLFVVSADVSLGLGAFVGHAAEFWICANQWRRFRGVCTRTVFARVAEDASSLATYEVTLRPELWRATQRRNSRLFQHVSIPAVATTLLDEHRIPHELRLSGSYRALELRTQYRETDHAFLSRLLEEAGISTFFEDDGQSPPRLVLHDAPQGAAERAVPLSFADDPSLAFGSPVPFATRLRIAQESRPGRLTRRDHDFWRPRAPLHAEAASDRAEESSHEQFDYEPSSFLAEIGEPERARQPASLATPVADDLGTARFLQSQGQDRARIHMEALQAERALVSFRTNVVDLAPGTVLRIVQHPRLDVGTKGLLSLRFTLEGEVASPHEWRFECEAAFADVPHRPALVTPRPQIHGVHSAVVVGPALGSLAEAAIPVGQPAAATLPAKEDIYVDEHGRVRVQFPWDREGRHDSHSSIWMRVSQGWAGAGYGLFTVPRIGQEVLVSFLDGDPDAPLVTGRVHNVAQPPPHKLPENKTVSTWKTSSSPGGGGFNELRFDDAAGREHVYLQAERDMDHLVKNDLKQAVGRDHNRYVERDEGEATGGSKTSHVNHNHVDVVGLHRVSHVGVHRVATVGVEDSTLVGSRWSVTIARGMSRKLARKLDDLAGELGGVLRSAATGVLGRLPADPLGSIAEAALTGFGAAAYDRFKNALGVLEGFESDPGPVPTSIQMVDRQIKLSTGEASILLDGPNITFVSAGKIAFHARDDVLVTSEKEIALGARGAAAVVSAEGDVVVQAGQHVHLNPYVSGEGLPPLRRRDGSEE